MISLAFLLKGQTFLKAMAPLIFFARRMGVQAKVFCYETRPGKPYDNLNFDTVDDLIKASHTSPCEVIKVKNDQHLVQLLSAEVTVDGILGQDIQHHYPFVIPLQVPTFSIAVFTDTLHYAAHHHRVGKPLPTITFWGSSELRDRAESLSGDKWPGMVLGSPMYDHWLWTHPIQGVEPERSVVFLTPPMSLLTPQVLQEINALAEHVVSQGSQFLLKDRPRFPWPFGGDYITQISHAENGWPYTSMQLIENTALCISCYSTAAFESRYLGRPHINLNIPHGADRNIGNVRVKSYGLELFSWRVMQHNPKVGLIEQYKNSITFEYQRPVITMDHNHSTSILKNILDFL